MLAAVYRGVDDIRVEEIPVPDVGTGELLVRVRACGICGTDLKKIQFGLVPPPRVFGHEMAGEIVNVGDGVREWSAGVRVAIMHHVPCLECHYCRHHCYAQCPQYKRTGTTAGFEPSGGGFAEYIRVMDWIVERGMVSIPNSVSYEEAALIEPVNTCLKAVKKAGIQAGHTVLVMGQGPIGLIFTQLSRSFGAAVYTTDVLESRRNISMRCGAASSWNPHSGDVRSLIHRETEGRGGDVVLLTVPDSALIQTALDLIRPGGKVILFAQTRPEEFARIDASVICMQEKDLIGSYSSDITLQPEASRLIFEQTLDVSSLITHRFPLAQIREAIEVAANPTERSLKVMLEP
jgi:L-iditol 2-dehydrogenase